MPNAYPTTVTVNVGALSIEDVVAVARYGVQVEIAPEALEEVATTRERVEELAQDPTPVYGISTGFGALARRHICLLYTSPSPRDRTRSRMPSSA